MIEEAVGTGPIRVAAEFVHDHEGGTFNRYWESHFELGVLLVKNREWQQAADELARSIALDPSHAAAHFQLARAYDKLGKPEMARAERAEHERLTAAETNAAQSAASAKAKPIP